jgi:hypothetical protein
MGLMDVLRGMANGPRGPAAPGGRGGISPITMGLLALLAYKTMRGEPLGGLFRQVGRQRTTHRSADAGQCRRQLSRLAAKRLGRSARRRSSPYTGFTYRFPVQMSNLATGYVGEWLRTQARYLPGLIAIAKCCLSRLFR